MNQFTEGARGSSARTAQRRGSGTRGRARHAHPGGRVPAPRRGGEEPGGFRPPHGCGRRGPETAWPGQGHPASKGLSRSPWEAGLLRGRGAGAAACGPGAGAGEATGAEAGAHAAEALPAPPTWRPPLTCGGAGEPGLGAWPRRHSGEGASGPPALRGHAAPAQLGGACVPRPPPFCALTRPHRCRPPSGPGPARPAACRRASPALWPGRSASPSAGRGALPRPGARPAPWMNGVRGDRRRLAGAVSALSRRPHSPRAAAP